MPVYNVWSFPKSQLHSTRTEGLFSYKDKPGGNTWEKDSKGSLYSSELVPMMRYIQRGGIPLTARLTIFFK